MWEVSKRNSGRQQEVGQGNARVSLAYFLLSMLYF